MGEITRGTWHTAMPLLFGVACIAANRDHCYILYGSRKIAAILRMHLTCLTVARRLFAASRRNESPPERDADRLFVERSSLPPARLSQSNNSPASIGVNIGTSDYKVFSLVLLLRRRWFHLSTL